MSDVVIRRCSVSELEQSPRLADLLDAYARESHIPELDEPCARLDLYKAMEASGAMHVIGVFAGDLVGLATILVYGLPHYDARLIAVTESLFVLPDARHGGTGTKLLQFCEAYAKELGAIAFMVSAPAGERLSWVLPKCGYRETNQVFLKALA